MAKLPSNVNPADAPIKSFGGKRSKPKPAPKNIINKLGPKERKGVSLRKSGGGA